MNSVIKHWNVTEKIMANQSIITFSPIGVIHTPHAESHKTPIQPAYATEISGKVEIFPEYTEGLKDLDGFSHIYLLYLFDRVDTAQLIVKPFLEDTKRGIFSTRSPFRPNPIGMSIVELDKIVGNILYIKNIDILDGTPLLDIKPYTSRFDNIPDAICGWQDHIDEETAQKLGVRDYKP